MEVTKHVVFRSLRTVFLTDSSLGVEDLEMPAMASPQPTRVHGDLVGSPPPKTISAWHCPTPVRIVSNDCLTLFSSFSYEKTEKREKSGSHQRVAF